MLHGWHMTRPHCGQLAASLLFRLLPTLPVWAAAARRAAGRQTEQEASKELPATPGYSSTATAPHKYQRTMGFPHRCVLLQTVYDAVDDSSGSWLSLLFLPPIRVHPSGQCHAKYRTAAEPAGPRLGHGGGMQKASSYVQLLFDAHRLGSMEMKPELWGCEEERARSHVKAVCWS